MTALAAAERAYKRALDREHKTGVALDRAIKLHPRGGGSYRRALEAAERARVATNAALAAIEAARRAPEPSKAKPSKAKPSKLSKAKPSKAKPSKAAKPKARSVTQEQAALFKPAPPTSPIKRQLDMFVDTVAQLDFSAVLGGAR